MSKGTFFSFLFQEILLSSGDCEEEEDIESKLQECMEKEDVDAKLITDNEQIKVCNC